MIIMVLFHYCYAILLFILCLGLAVVVCPFCKHCVTPVPPVGGVPCAMCPFSLKCGNFAWSCNMQCVR